MSIEGLWRVRFHSNAYAQFPGGAGVVIFETGRIFGGDSLMYYVGDYKAHGNGSLRGQLHVGTHTPGGQSVFGPLEEFDLELLGKMEDKKITVRGVLQQSPQLEITADLEFIADLPG